MAAAYILGGLVLVMILLPVLAVDPEKYELNDKTRASIGGRFIRLSDGYTHYDLSGPEAGRTVVLVHGNAAPCLTWDNTVNALTGAGFRVLRYDIFGHGYSDRPARKAYNRDLYDRQLLEIMDRLHIQYPVYLAGTSQGGSICAYFAARHPGRVAKIALLSPLFDAFGGRKVAMMLRKKGLGEYMMRVMGNSALNNPGRVLHSQEKTEELAQKLKSQLRYRGKRRAVLANMRGDTMEDATVYYREIERQGIPAMLTWGEHDASIPEASIDRLRAVVPGIEYHRIPDASHLAHYECPQCINELLIGFFGGQRAAG